MRREVQEEVGLEIENIEYVTSLATVHADENPSLVISCLAENKRNGKKSEWRAGIRAQILGSGTINVGDRLSRLVKVDL